MKGDQALDSKPLKDHVFIPLNLKVKQEVKAEEANEGKQIIEEEQKVSKEGISQETEEKRSDEKQDSRRDSSKPEISTAWKLALGATAVFATYSMLNPVTSFTTPNVHQITSGAEPPVREPLFFKEQM